MSHYAVAVFTRDYCPDIDSIMEPYDEQRSVVPYISYTKESLVEHKRNELQSLFETRYAEWKMDPAAYEKNSSIEHTQFLKSLPELMKKSDEEIYQEALQLYGEDEIDDSGNIISTYNPDSKWDWYVMGGRWHGMLVLKPGKTGERGDHFGSEVSQDYDAAFVEDIDFDEIKRRYLRNLTPYEEAMKSGFFKEEYMREQFPTEDEYIRRHTNFSTYAVVTPDGVWHSPGDMGWWGMSSDSVEEKRSWDDGYYGRFIKPAIEKGLYVTIVDCHI